MTDKVLVVDDESLVGYLLTEFLTEEGYEVIAARDGVEALERTKRDTPDLILLDINMPRISGIEACRKLKEGERTRNIPVIVMTGLSYDQTEALEAGADDCVQKPFDLVELSNLVKCTLGVEA